MMIRLRPKSTNSELNDDLGRIFLSSAVNDSDLLRLRSNTPNLTTRPTNAVLQPLGNDARALEPEQCFRVQKLEIAYGKALITTFFFAKSTDTFHVDCY